MWHYRMAVDSAGKYGVYEKYPAVKDHTHEDYNPDFPNDLYAGPIVDGFSEEDVIRKMESYASLEQPKYFPVDQDVCRMVLRDLKAFDKPDYLDFEGEESWVDEFNRNKQIDE